MAAKSSTDVRVSITTHPDAAKGPKTLQQALGLVITDKASHASVRAFGKEIKQKIAEIEAYYRTEANETGIIDPLFKAYKAALATMNAHLAPFVEADRVIQHIDTSYVREQQRIEAEAAESARQKAEAAELARRQKEADKAEAAALKLEASSDDLSPRELQYVFMVVTDTRQQTPGTLAAIASRCGYKDPAAQVARLMKSDKINTAIANAQKAKALREQSVAKQAAPVIVDVETKPSEVVDGGVRTYYSCDPDVDVRALAKAVVAGTVNPLALSPNLTYLNMNAKALRELFPAAFPGCKLSRRDGTVSR